MGKSYKDDDWHDPDEMWEEEERKRRRRQKRTISEDEVKTDDYIPFEPFRKR